MTELRDLGVFCGTFNPIHWGHLLLAEFARDQFNLEKVIVVTSPNPPHRKDELLDAESRFLLVEAACKSNPYFEASRIELEREGPSYTVDTLRAIAGQENDKSLRLNLIVGKDNLHWLKEWHDSDSLFSLCRILVASRSSAVTREEVLAELPSDASFELIEFPQVPVSASLIRQRIKQKKTVLYLVPEAVEKIIRSKGFYLEEGTIVAVESEKKAISGANE